MVLVVVGNGCLLHFGVVGLFVFGHGRCFSTAESVGFLQRLLVEF